MMRTLNSLLLRQLRQQRVNNLRCPRASIRSDLHASRTFCSAAPSAAHNYDYFGRSLSHITQLFAEANSSSEVNTKDSPVPFIIVWKSNYNAFKSAHISPTTIELMENVGSAPLNLKVFPEAKVLRLPFPAMSGQGSSSAAAAAAATTAAAAAAATVTSSPSPHDSVERKSEYANILFLDDLTSRARREEAGADGSFAAAFKWMKANPDKTYVFYEYAGTRPGDFPAAASGSLLTKASIFSQVCELSQATADRLCFAYTEHCYSDVLDSIFKRQSVESSTAGTKAEAGASRSKRPAKIIWPYVYASSAASASASSSSSPLADGNAAAAAAVTPGAPCAARARRNFIAMARAYYLMKLLVDTPALSLGPAELEAVAVRLATSYSLNTGDGDGDGAAAGAGTGTGTVQLRSYVGKHDLLHGTPTKALGYPPPPPPSPPSPSSGTSDESSGRRGRDASASSKGFPQVWAVGMAAAAGREPRVVDFTWSPPNTDCTASPLPLPLPEIVLVGKGVVFDSGGLNIKTGNGMLTMFKDMAGAAQALSLASLIMDSGLQCRLRVLLPIVENCISSESLRPGDVIRSRSGKTILISNTDAEGRLILSDCLVAACEEEEEEEFQEDGREGPARGGDDARQQQQQQRRRLIIDFATLTGAARVALGNELAAVFSNDHSALMRFFHLSHDSAALDGYAGTDPCWALPLWEPMRRDLKSNIADIQNAPGTPGGAITAALYLSEFITPLVPEASAAADAAGVSYLSASLRREANRAASDEDSSGGTSATESDSEQAVAGNTGRGQGRGQGRAAPVWIHVDFFALSKGGRAIPQGMRTAFAFIQEHIQTQQQLQQKQTQSTAAK